MGKVKGAVIVRFDIEVTVVLPEGIEFAEDDGNNKVTDKCEERAIEAAVNAFPGYIKVYMDGEQEKPTSVYFDVCDNNVEAVWGEEE
jgi:hypothetical protein